MIAVLLAVCLAVPLFDMTGPVCTPERQEVECGCSEGMRWDDAVDATWFEVYRREAGQAQQLVSGDTRSRTHPAYVDDDGMFVPAIKATAWYFAWDTPFPVESVTYAYCAKGCRLVEGVRICSTYCSDEVLYVGAPYGCFADGVEVPCYAGDPVTP